MEFLKSSKRRSLVSELVYIALNVVFAASLLIIVLAFNSPWLAIALVLLAKWRILAVRPRYWFANIQANLVDIIVSVSIVVLLYGAIGALFAQILFTAAYIFWLLYIKPRSKRLYVAIQAGTATFLGTIALMVVSYDLIASVVVAGMWVIGYSAARHVLSSHGEAHRSFYSLVWGLVLAELGWLAYHWTFAYAIPGVGDIQLPQIALIVLAVSFFAERAYDSYSRHGGIRSADIIMPGLLSLSVIIVLLLFFNTLGIGTF